MTLSVDVYDFLKETTDAIMDKVACPVKRWNYDDVTLNTFQKMTSTFPHFLKFISFLSCLVRKEMGSSIQPT